jgi:glycosyltransferase involved in cell wall biosynthesis
MKILYLIDTLSLGGAQTVLKGVFENQKENHDIFLYALRKTEITVNIEHPNVFVDNSVGRYSVAPFFRLKKLLKRNKIEVLHCQLPRSHVFGYFLKKYFFNKLKLIIHEQGDIFENFPLHAHFLRKTAGFTSMFITCSEATKDELVSKTGVSDDKVITVYNFFDEKRFNPENIAELRRSTAESLKENENSFVFGFAGRLIERKGWREFVLSASEFINDKKVKLLIAGAGDEEQELMKMIDVSGLAEKVLFLGYYPDIMKFYSMIDCLVVPSHWEPMGITEIEAMALKIPVIASDVIGLNEVVKHNVNGVLFKAKDTASLVNAMKTILLQKELRYRISETAFNTIEKFTYSAFQQKLDEIYKNLYHLNK